MMSEAGVLDPTNETFREYERVVDRNTSTKSGQEPSSFPLSSSLAGLDLPSAQ